MTMAIGKLIRLNRLFSKADGRFCSVAVDHFVGYGERMPAGLRNLPRTLAQIMAGGPDAVTMQKGTAMNCWKPYAGKTALIVQTGCFTADERIIETLVTAEECQRLGADAMAVAIGVCGPNEGRFIRILSDKVEEAVRWDLPIVAHIYPRDFSGKKVEILHNAEHIAWAVRVGIECGADVIKVGFTGDVASFRDIVRACPVPIVAAGGPQCPTLLEALENVAKVMQSGARGATIGRNIWGYSDIAGALRAFRAVVHDGLTPEEALHAGAGERAAELVSANGAH